MSSKALTYGSVAVGVGLLGLALWRLKAASARKAASGSQSLRSLSVAVPVARVMKPQRFLVIHGLGMDKRGYVDVDKWGTTTLAQYNERIQAWADTAGATVTMVQTNELDEIKRLFSTCAAAGHTGVVINPGGFVNRSVEELGLHPIVNACGVPVVEVHYGNPLRRIQSSPVAGTATGMVCGLGVQSYTLALQGLLEMASM